MKTKVKNNIVHYVKGDLFDNILERLSNTTIPLAIIVPHVCNNVGSFGAGFAKEVAIRYPIVQENFYLLGKRTQLGYTQFVDTHTNKNNGSKIIFANMIAQNGLISPKNPRPLNYAALVRTMSNVKNYILTNSKTNDIDIEIHAPKFGCGLAGGNWHFIHDLIEDMWGDQTVVIYEYKK